MKPISIENPYRAGDTFILTPFDPIPEAQKGNITILESVGSWVHIGIWKHTGDSSYKTIWMPACRMQNYINSNDENAKDRGFYRRGFPIPDIRSNYCR